MKKNIFTLAAVAVSAVALASCGSKPAGPQTVEGVVLNASMNTVTVITTAGDTLNLSTMNTNPAKITGVLIDDSVKVTYADTTVDGAKVLQVNDLTVTVRSPYYYIEGTWVEPNPIDSTAVQGMRLNQSGAASSVGIATLVFKSWNLTDANTLVLTGESVGNGQTIPVADTLTVNKLNADSLVLSDAAGQVVWRLARQN